MKSVLIVFYIALILTLVTACGTKRLKDMMAEWPGASQDELVQAWGYPETQDDLVRVDEHTQVFTYRSFVQGAPCTLSFTLVDKTVVQWKYRGANCPKIEGK